MENNNNVNKPVKPVQTPVEQPKTDNTGLNKPVDQKQMGKEYDNYVKNAKKSWKVNGAWEEPKSFDEFSDNFMKGFAKGSGVEKFPYDKGKWKEATRSNDLGQLEKIIPELEDAYSAYNGTGHNTNEQDLADWLTKGAGLNKQEAIRVAFDYFNRKNAEKAEKAKENNYFGL